MAKAIQKITLNQAENISFDKIELSQKNVRRIKNGVTIEQLAEDIALRGLLQSLNVRPIRDVDGEETGRFDALAGGRRYKALELLIKEKAYGQGSAHALHRQSRRNDVGRRRFACGEHPA